MARGGQQSNNKLRHLRETGTTLAQLFGAWAVEQKSLSRCQDTQKALQDVLQVLSLSFAPSRPSALSPLSVPPLCVSLWQSKPRAVLTGWAQGTDDPPDELLEAAEQACEEYDRSMSMTATLRDKYLSFTSVS